MYIVDNLIAIRIMWLITVPFSSWPAYKDGTINEDGIVIKRAVGNAKDNWTMLHRMVAKIKKLIALAPGGKTRAAGALTSYLLQREGVEDINDSELKIMFEKVLTDISDEQVKLFEDIGSTVAIAGPGVAPNENGDVDPLGPATIKNKYTKRNGMFRRQSFKEFIGK